MQTRFLITDKDNISYGTLDYNCTTKEWHIEINPSRTWDDTPLSLAIYIRNNIFSLNDEQSLNWVRDRLMPPNRHGIHQALHDLGLKDYDEYALLQVTNGVSAHDDLFIVEKN
ncbi:MAG: hypothetical protein LBG97_02690 [Coriobacteriales bacterium]|jgi:hypothetical protein|nr:hypothetical protein [Coriobacteriales bacterium]